jgi:hypothetical protein
MFKIFKLGDRIGGFCQGYFGRDDYDDKTCVLVTAKYAVFENEEGIASVLNYEEDMDKIDKQFWIHGGDL